jgi:hypothetical protein
MVAEESIELEGDDLSSTASRLSNSHSTLHKVGPLELALPDVSAAFLPESPLSIRRSHTIGVVVAKSLRVQRVAQNILLDGVVEILTVENIGSLESDIQVVLVNMGRDVLSVRHVKRLSDQRVLTHGASRDGIHNCNGGRAAAPQSINRTTDIHHNNVRANVQRTRRSEGVDKIRFHRVAIDVNSMSLAVSRVNSDGLINAVGNGRIGDNNSLNETDNSLSHS